MSGHADLALAERRKAHAVALAAQGCDYVGPSGCWETAALDAIRDRDGDLVRVRRLGPEVHGPDQLADPSGAAMRLLGVRGHGHFVVRPDGHVGYRADHGDLSGARRYLDRWLTFPV